jgi:hypothetical protein
MAQDALRLAQGVRADHARLALLRIGAPPAIDVIRNFLLRPPFVDRQAESGFRDEGVASQRRESLAGSVRFEFVIARRNPDRAIMFETDLRRAEHMAGRMQRDLHAIAVKRLAVIEAFDANVAEAMAQDRRAIPVTKIDAMARSRVIRMAMSNDRSLDRPPRINVKITGGAIKSCRIRDDQVHC